MNEEDRRSPEEFLAAAQFEEGQLNKGQLKIFLGMAAGVGKTYAMLKEAQELYSEGIDIIVGIVDTHGRPETEKILKGLKILPEKIVSYKGGEFKELDVDAIINLMPDIVLVDELAHNNVPGAKHPKRWQDVIEILENGINVYTTLNIQHIESLNDIIRGITDISVRETVPDHIVEMASSIQLVDLTPDELLERLKEGKVYLADQSRVAIDNFFQRDRLTALREIVLRYTADKIDYDLRQMIPAKDQLSKWKPREKLLVAISSRPQSQILIRLGKRLAGSLDAPWSVVFVDNGRFLDEKEKDYLYKNFSLARDLGAEVETVHDLDVAEGIKKVANHKGVTQIIIGRTPKTPFLYFFKNATLLDRLSGECENLDIHVVRMERYPSYGRKKFYSHLIPKRLSDYFIVSAIVVLTFFLNFLFLPFTGYKIAGMLFLLCILGLGQFVRQAPMIYVAILYGIIWAAFFVPHPTNDFSTSFEDLALIFIYGVTAAAMGILIDGKVKQKEMLNKQAKISSFLYDIVSQLSSNKPKEEVFQYIKETLILFLDGSYEFLIKEANNGLIMEDPENLLLNDKEKSTAIWSFENGKEAGTSTETLPSLKNLYLPIKATREVLGVLVYCPPANKVVTLEEKNFLITVCQHIAGYLELLNSYAMPTNKSKYSIREFVEGCEKMISKFSKQNKIIIQLENDLPLVNYDKRLLEILFLNLMINAIERSSEGAQIDVEANEQGGDIVLTVSDEGEQIAENKLEEILENPKVGIGLAQARLIAELYNGSLIVENRPKNGVRMTVSLPV